MKVFSLRKISIFILVFGILINFSNCGFEKLFHLFQSGLRENDPDYKFSILALGDSICYGHRNKNKGFVGDLGYPYVNIGRSSATISNKVTKVINIPDQLINYYETHINQSYPNIIISNGGVNDYSNNAELGEIPTVAVKSDEEADQLDRDTVLGALQFLFFKMIRFYPKAHRFFILGHKTTRYTDTLEEFGEEDVDYLNNLEYMDEDWEKNRTGIDWSITKNEAGYTQTEEYDAFRTVCNLYGVVCIDLFNKGIINSAFESYVSEVPYSKNESVTYTDYCDSDGVHPLDYGYVMGYKPVILDAISPYLPEEGESNLGRMNKPLIMMIVLSLMLLL